MTDRVALPRGGVAVALEGLHRGIAGVAETDPQGRLLVEVDERPDVTPAGDRTRELETEYRAVVDEILELRGDDGRIAGVRALDRRARRARRHLRLRPDLTFEQKVELLETVDVVERLELALTMQRERPRRVQIRQRIREDVDAGMRRSSSASSSFASRWTRSARSSARTRRPSSTSTARRSPRPACPTPSASRPSKELGRLERMGEGSPESHMIRSYLDWLLAVPWGDRSDELLDPVLTREILDADHAGLEDVKERIVEYLAVAQAPPRARDRARQAVGRDPHPDRAARDGQDLDRRVDRTALNREFVRMSLGGVRDEAEIRGHRRTYIGALPGRLVRALRDAGTMNPVILLDEVDKVGADWRGDPSAALLEVLDPAQNHSFRDHYLDVELDLSQVVFIATANMAETIPGPLLDRMEVIRFDGYTTDEKVAIARGYLWPRQRERHGLVEDEVSIADDALADRDHGVHPRGGRPQSRARARDDAAQDRHEGRVRRRRDAGRARRRRCARRARPAEVLPGGGGAHRVPGVATGLAVTGDRRRRAVRRGDRRWPAPERLVLTGQLGDVMKESAQIALSCGPRAAPSELGDRARSASSGQFHVHVPAGAIPKDGPSAGITMATALASLLTGRPVQHTVGMTGEVTLQGRVLPIGGLKQKVLAAHAAGLTDVDPAGAQPRRPRRRPGGRPRGDDASTR